MAESVDSIRRRLEQCLQPEALRITDVSHEHRGHPGVPPEGGSHFVVDIVSVRFRGRSRVERHRMIHAALADAFAAGLHALAIHARTPEEFPGTGDSHGELNVPAGG